MARVIKGHEFHYTWQQYLLGICTENEASTTQTNRSAMQDNRTVTLQTFQTINAIKRLTISNACANHNKNQITVKQCKTFQILKQHEFNYTGQRYFSRICTENNIKVL